MKTMTSISIHFHDEDEAEAMPLKTGEGAAVSTKTAGLFFWGATLPEAQRIADAINAAIDGAKARAAADAEAVKIAAQ